MNYVVTLVNGTWAEDAKWAQPNSPLSHYLRDRFGDSLQLQAFKWSGSNRQTVRLAAARNLEVKLRENKSQFPDAVHFVIAHSHGGLVALYALRDSELRKNTDGLICLSTPFIDVRPRSLTAVLVTLIILVLLAPISLLIKHAESIDKFGYGLASAVLVPVIACGLFALYAYLRNWLATVVERTCDQFLIPELNAEKILIIRTVGDEASSALGAVQFFSWIASRLSNLCVSGASWLGDKSMNPTIKGDISPMFAFLYGLVGFRLSSIASQLGMFIAIALIGPIYAIIALPLGILSIPFGGDLFLKGLLVDISAEPTPRGIWTIHQYGADEGKDVLDLAHSTYTHEKVLETLTAWIRMRGHRLLAPGE